MKTTAMIFLMLFNLILGGTAGKTEAIDIGHLSSNGDDWKLYSTEKDGDSTIITLQADKWLMYFLHWRPLTDQNRILSIKYVKKLLLSFWGPEMPFEIMGEGGETRVGGHPAYFIDGTIYNNKIQTRFIVWNCEQTGRQFIADCNINKSLGTHAKYLSRQFDITSTISCHGNKAEKTLPWLTRKYYSKKFNLSFFIPSLWRTKPFPEKKWFPGGQSATNGSLWTLVTDSQKIIRLKIMGARSTLNSAVLNQQVQNLVGKPMPTSNKEITATITQIKINELTSRGDQFWGIGQLAAQFEYQKKKYTTKYLFKAGLLKKAKPIFLLCAFAANQEVWQRPFDLSPDKKAMDDFVTKMVMPALKIE